MPRNEKLDGAFFRMADDRTVPWGRFDANPHACNGPCMPPTAAHPLTGIFLMVAGTAFLSWNDAVAKHLAATLPVGEVVFFRQIAALILVGAYGLATVGVSAFRVVDAPVQFLRGLAFVGSTLFIVSSLAVLPLAIVTAIAFSSPIIVAVLSGPILGEHVTARRWLGVCIGFIGVLIVIRPGSASFTWALLLPALAATATAFRDTLTRKLARTDTSLSILFWSSVLVILAAGVTSISGWKPISAAEGGWLVLNGFLNASAHFLMITAYRHGDAALLSPFRYSGLIWAILLGWLVWAHLPDFWSMVGSMVIIASSFYVAEATKKR